MVVIIFSSVQILVSGDLYGGAAGIDSRGRPYQPRDKVSRSGQRIKEKRPHSMTLYGHTKLYFYLQTEIFHVRSQTYPEVGLSFF